MPIDNDRPSQALKLAVQYMAISIAFGLFALVFLVGGTLWTHPEVFQHRAVRENLTTALYLAKTFSGILIFTAIYCFILGQIIKERNWARIVCALKIAIDVFLMMRELASAIAFINVITFDNLVSHADVFSIAFVSGLIAVLSTILECYGLYILFTSPAKGLFRNKKLANQTP
ncbi:MAG: hypothetical protein WCD70_12605 [Alphaproteobacteria bacterium]